MHILHIRYSHSIVAGFSGDVADDAIDVRGLGDDAFADAAEDRIGNLRPLGHHDSGKIRHGQRLREGIAEETLVVAVEGVRGKNITRSCSHASGI